MDAAEEHSRSTATATPILSIGSMNHENNKGKSIDSVSTLSTVLVKPTYLQNISNATFADVDMKKFVELALGMSPNFWIIHCGGVPLVVWCYNSLEQIVLLSFSGFQILALENYHGSILAGHFGTHKTLKLLY